MVAAYFDNQGLIYTDVVPKGQTINSDYFCKSISNFLRRFRQKRPQKAASNWRLHMDNARPHVSRATSEFLASKKVETIDHPAYSPDLAPADFWLFPLVKKKMGGMAFKDQQEVLNAWYGVTRSIPEEAFAEAFRSWIKRWTKCVNKAGDYVEK